ncbi:MFS transporter [Devosia algicola]|uniref:MFS transporter n=1 Tax=Devosia algicola TaxID=3026418 RepID=A0ABY7YQS5_9HYPH|nr:MFS transporter [Devosia algicola]WDR03478.1 MFS transporter [Devosia algicola]
MKPYTQSQVIENSSAAHQTLWYAAFALVILALGHTISNLVRTLPAISSDVVAADLAVSAGDVAAMTGFYHLAFAAGQIPVGVALDRYSVKSVATVLLALIAVGSMFAALVQGPLSFAVTQAMLGLGCSGMLLCPLTYAARTTEPRQFALWSAVILAVGNSGMIISASPMAWLIEQFGWRVAYGLPAVLALAVVAVVQLVIKPVAPATQVPANVWLEIKEVGSIGLSPALRSVMILAFVSFAVMIGVRGVWGGPWLMDAKNMSRLGAGNVLLALTLMLITMPMVVGLIEKRIGRPHLILTVGHILAGVALILLPAGANGGLVATMLGTQELSPLYDTTLIIAFGMMISVQPLLFALCRAAVSSQHAGKALSAVNLVFLLALPSFRDYLPRLRRSLA